MSKGTIEWDSARSEAYLCTAPGCNYCYSLAHGYFLFEAGSYNRHDLTYRQACPVDGYLMYISEIQGPEEYRWLCARDGCRGEIDPAKKSDGGVLHDELKNPKPEPLDYDLL
jgi:hypothetical protein